LLFTEEWLDMNGKTKGAEADGSPKDLLVPQGSAAELPPIEGAASEPESELGPSSSALNTELTNPPACQKENSRTERWRAFVGHWVAVLNPAVVKFGFAAFLIQVAIIFMAAYSPGCLSNEANLFLMVSALVTGQAVIDVNEWKVALFKGWVSALYRFIALCLVYITMVERGQATPFWA